MSNLYEMTPGAGLTLPLPRHPGYGRRSSAPQTPPTVRTRNWPGSTTCGRIYYLQMTECGATHLKACCVVAGHLAERAWTVLHRARRT